MTASTFQEETSIESTLAAKLRGMAHALVAGRPDAVAEVYAPEGVIVGLPGPRMPFAPIVGRENIARSWRDTPASRWTLDVLSTHVQGDRAVQHGRSVLDVAGQRFDTAFICIWQRGADGTWHIHADVFSPWIA